MNSIKYMAKQIAHNMKDVFVDKKDSKDIPCIKFGYSL